MGNANEKVSMAEESIAKEDSGGSKSGGSNGEISEGRSRAGNGAEERGVGSRQVEGISDSGEVAEEMRVKKPVEKVDPINDGDFTQQRRRRGSQEPPQPSISLRDRLSLKKRCRLNIPPRSRVPEPTYRIKLLLNEKYEGPFGLELIVNPSELRITGFEGVVLKRIRKRDIIFVQTMNSDSVRMFIRSSEDQDVNSTVNEEELNEQNLYTSQYLGEIMQIICKFVSSQDCESFEFFFPFIYGLMVHTDRVKIPVSDYIDFGEYVIGSSKHILKRLDEYKDLNDKICDGEVSGGEEDEEDILDSYEDRMIAQEREFFSRKSLELIYKSDFSFGLDLSNSLSSKNDLEDEESIIRERQEKYSKFFPVSITGEAESGGIITFKDISTMGLKYVPEVIEWRISKNIGGGKADYNDTPISVNRSFQLNEDHVGRYIQAKVFRHIGQDLSDTYISSEAQSNIIIPGDKLLVNIAELLMYGKSYRVDISTYDALSLLSVENPAYYIQLMRQTNYYDTYAYNPMVSCILDVKHSNIKLLIPTPSILQSHYFNSKTIPLCFSYSEFIMTKKSDWFGYNDYPPIYECIMRQGELLGKVSLVLSILEGKRKDVSVYFETERDKNIVYFSLLFRQLSPNFSLEEIGKESKNKKFVSFKKQFIYGLKKANWRSRLLLLTVQQAGTYVRELGKIAKYDPSEQ
ncbi:hypothetical protein OIY81_1653 [Cryptosporidium canis]|nr:hypothetical protein OIY81_1653 [Cryptosporidium canis]